MPTLLSQNFSLVVQDRDAKSTTHDIEDITTTTIVDMTIQSNTLLTSSNTITTTNLKEEEATTIPVVSTNDEPIHHQQVTIPTISIWTAAEQGDVATLNQYIARHPQPIDLLNKRDPKTECTLIHLAIIHNRTNPQPVLECLLTHGANPCAPNIYNVQALHTLPLHCSHQVKECMGLLLDHGADIHCRDGDGWTPLHYAARFCTTESLLPVIDLLLGHGADLLARDCAQRTPLFGLLANGDHVHVLRQLDPSLGVWHCRGEFLDPHTRRSHLGSLVLQAAKYLRVACLEWMVQTPQVLDQIMSVLTKQELDLARQWIQQEENEENKAKIMSLLEYLSTLVETTTQKRRQSIVSATSQESPTLVKRFVRFLSRHKKPIDGDIGRSIVV